MIERGGRLHEDSGVYEMRDRAEVELGKGVEVLNGTSPSACMFRVRDVRKLGEGRRQV